MPSKSNQIAQAVFYCSKIVAPSSGCFREEVDELSLIYISNQLLDIFVSLFNQSLKVARQSVGVIKTCKFYTTNSIRWWYFSQWSHDKLEITPTIWHSYLRKGTQNSLNMINFKLYKQTFWHSYIYQPSKKVTPESHLSSLKITSWFFIAPK